MKESVFDIHEEVEGRHWWFVGRRKILRNILRYFIGMNDQCVIFDVGCGTGGTVHFLSTEFCCIGVDSSEYAIKRAKHQYPNQSFICGNAEAEVRAEKDNISVILLMDVLEHIENDKEFLRNLIKHMSVGAKVIITVPAGKKLWSEHDISVNHYRRYEADDLRALWVGANVRQICLSYFNSRLYPIIRIIRLLGNYFHFTFGNKKTDLLLPPKFLNWLLMTIFSGEGERILSTMKSQPNIAYSYGASLIAVLEITDVDTDHE